MIEFDYTITHPVGLYAKLADGLVAIANRYQCDVYVVYQDKKVSMKSLMGVISLGVPCQGVVHFIIDGRDQVLVKETIDCFLRDVDPFYYCLKRQVLL